MDMVNLGKTVRTKTVVVNHMSITLKCVTQSINVSLTGDHWQCTSVIWQHTCKIFLQPLSYGFADCFFCQCH